MKVLAPYEVIVKRADEGDAAHQICKLLQRGWVLIIAISDVSGQSYIFTRKRSLWERVTGRTPKPFARPQAYAVHKS